MTLREEVLVAVARAAESRDPLMSEMMQVRDAACAVFAAKLREAMDADNLTHIARTVAPRTRRLLASLETKGRL